ncbi:MAG: ABC transporter permease [Chloroflexi bacterium]|nr:ABC transporter permease [Chloroflexota bacterium]
MLGPDGYKLVRALVTNPLSIAGLVILGLFVLVAIFAPMIAPPPFPEVPYTIPRDGYSNDPRPPMSEWNRFQPPPAFWLEPLTGSEEWVHVLGTASGQWDIFYGLVWGTRTAFRVGIVITASVVTIGILVGSVSAYYGGKVDMILMRITDVFLTMPFLMAALVLSSILAPRFGKTIVAPMIALIVFGWMGYARLIRSDVLSVKQRDYVMAARVIGVSNRRILLRHILPNAIFPTMVVASMDVGSYVITFAALSFLGIGAEIGFADWGQLLSFARDWITALDVYWYIVLYPGMTLVLFVLAWNLIGDAVRDVFDPRLRGGNS